jgi:hypothetical protein
MTIDKERVGDLNARSEATAKFASALRSMQPEFVQSIKKELGSTKQLPKRIHVHGTYTDSETRSLPFESRGSEFTLASMTLASAGMPCELSSPQEQSLSAFDTNTWTWTIMPRESGLHDMVLSVVVRDKSGEKQQIIVPIRITVKGNLSDSIVAAISAHVEFLVASILFPLLLFIWNRVKAVRKKRARPWETP